MASDCIDAASALRMIERALHEPTDEVWVEEVENMDENYDGSDLDDDTLDRLQSEGKSRNTVKHTIWEIKTFLDWANQRDIPVDFDEIPSMELARILRKFYAEYRTKKGELPTPGTLRSLRGALHRTLKDPPHLRSINIIIDKEFMSANSMFESRCKAYFANGGRPLKHKPSIELGDMEKLSSYFGDLEHMDPTRLVELIWFNLCFYFGRRGREGWRNFTKSTLVLKTDDKHKKYLTFSSAEKTKNWQGSSSGSDQDFSDVRMYENESSGDPVAAYLFYLSKLHPDCDALFQSPRKCFEKAGILYNNAPMGKNTLSTIMQKISKKAGLSQVYTCHSVRASTITYMYHAGVDTKQICNITKHKSEESLKHYISGSSSAQKRNSSELLHGVTTRKKPVAVNELSHDELLPAVSPPTSNDVSPQSLDRQLSIQHVGMSYGTFDLGFGIGDFLGAPSHNVTPIQHHMAVPRFGSDLNFLTGANINNCTVNYNVSVQQNSEN